ncbi:hypothetical protein BDW22DRAFT_1349870 [Trametopsis cervina]|nr:hypothetical protein BDW22DRAFT_1349870 [Trametopsis cervina]
MRTSHLRLLFHNTRPSTISLARLTRTMSTESTLPQYTPERLSELRENLAEIRARLAAVSTATAPQREPTLIAVSKLKPATDVHACYALGQRAFGENYAQELEEKAGALASLPGIQWHFIGTLQSNKAKSLAQTPNLYAVQTLTSSKAASALDKHLPASRPRLNVFLQVNTSGEDNKSGLPPLSPSSTSTEAKEAKEAKEGELTALARHVLTSCPRLRLLGLMTIGSLAESLSGTEENSDFGRLAATRDVLQEVLRTEFPLGEEGDGERWGEGGKLLLSMGMSSDFEAAVRAGSDVVRVGTSIFGGRPPKGQVS